MFKPIRTLLALGVAALLAGAGFGMVDTISSPQFQSVISATETSTLALGNATYSPKIDATQLYTYGTGAGQINLSWTDTSTVAASAADTVKLRMNALTGAFGNAINFGHVKTLVIKCKSTNTNDVIIGNAADSTWVGPFGSAAHTHSCKPGGSYSWSLPGTGYAVTDATKKLKIMNGSSGSTVFYTIMMFGTTT